MQSSKIPSNADMTEAVKEALWRVTPLAPVTAPEGLTPAQALDWLWYAGTAEVCC